MFWLVLALSSTDEDEDITDCAKCRQLVGDPTTLPCLDSLCATCFKEVRDAHSGSSTGVATCPRCGDPFRLPTNHLQTLPDRGFVDTLVVLRKIAGRNLADDNCEICKNCKRSLSSSEPIAAAEYYCIECRQKMCAVCASRHPGCSFTKNHNITGLGLDSSNKVLNANRHFTPCCVNHKDERAVAHCYECCESLCAQCQSLRFCHQLETLTDQTYSQLTGGVKFLCDQIPQVLTGISLAEKIINDKADESISLIQKQRDDLLNRLHFGNNQTISTVQPRSSRLSFALKFAKELLERGSLEDLLLNYSMLNNRVTNLCNIGGVSSGVIDVSPSSLIDAVCASQQSKSIFSLAEWMFLMCCIWKLSENLTWLIFTARRHASAIYAVVMCLSVRPSVTSRYCIETTGRNELVFGMEASFHLSHSCVVSKFGYLQKSGYILLGLCPRLRT